MDPTFDMLGLVVADLEASLVFYRRLGFDIPDDAAGQPHVEVTLANGLRVAWDTHETIRSFDPEWAPPTGGARVALAFACASPADVDAQHDRLVAAGAPSHKAPWDAFWGQRYAQILDPDGNVIDLFAALDA